MSHKILAIVGLTLAFATYGFGQYQIDVLLNPGFEFPDNVGTAGAPPSSWTITGAAEVRSSVANPSLGERPPQGKQYLELARTESISQTFDPSLDAGETLTAEFMVSDVFTFFGASSSRFLRAELEVDGVPVAARDFTTIVGPDIYRRRQISYFNPPGSPTINNMTLRIKNIAPFSTTTIYFPVRIDDVELWISPRFAAPTHDVHFDFDDRAVGPWSDPTYPHEEWSAIGPVSIASGNDSVHMPASGTRWLEVSTDGTDPMNFNDQSRARLWLFPQSTEIAFNWTALTNETLGNQSFYDLVRVRLLDDSGTVPVVIETRILVDTRDTSPNWSFSSQSSAATGAVLNQQMIESRRETFVIDSSLVGHRLRLECVAQNYGDDGVETVLQMDLVRSITDVRFPGSDESLLRMATSVRPYDATGQPNYGILTGGPGEDRKHAMLGDEIQVACFANTSDLDFLPYVLVAELVTTGIYPASFPELGFWMTLSNSQIVVDGTQPSLFGPAHVIAPAGVLLTFEAPAGLYGQSILTQFIVPTNTVGQNGFFVSSDTHEITF